MQRRLTLIKWGLLQVSEEMQRLRSLDRIENIDAKITALENRQARLARELEDLYRYVEGN